MPQKVPPGPFTSEFEGAANRPLRHGAKLWPCGSPPRCSRLSPWALGVLSGVICLPTNLQQSSTRALLDTQEVVVMGPQWVPLLLLSTLGIQSLCLFFFFFLIPCPFHKSMQTN